MGLAKKEEKCDEITEIANQLKEKYKKNISLNSNVPLFKPLERRSPPQPQNLPPDWTSIQGQFGWIEIEKYTLPYILRSQRRYISERMANSILFLEYKLLVNDDVLGDYVEKIKLTSHEASLLNEINFKHCDSFYGKSAFTVMDFLISTEDINEMNTFYKFLYKCFVEKIYSREQRCGFIKISGQNCVPYVAINAYQYVPLFYFEGECQYLEEMATAVSGWDLIYLKLCCKLQGIRKGLYEKEAIQVVNLELVKQYFLPGTKFEQFWLIDNPKLFAELSPMIFKSLFIGSQQSEIQNARSACRQDVQQKTQLNITQQYNRTQPANSLANTNNYQNTNVYSNSSLLKPHTSQNVTAGPPGNFKYGIYRIPDIVCGQKQVPFAFKYVQIGNTFVHRCINMEPYNAESLLVTLEEIANFIFRVPVEKVAHAVRAMSLVIYLPNNIQTAMLQSVGLRNTAGMIQVDVFKENLPQLRYILSST